MTTIQDRLRSQEPMTRTEAADRIDALEKALELADARFHMHGMATMTERLEEYGYEHEAQVHGLEDYRAALGEGE